MSEHGERLPIGPQGERGKPGERGPGLTPAVRRTLVYLFTTAAVLAATALFWVARTADTTTAQYRHEQAATAAAGRVLEHKLCTTFGKLAALKPPPGNPNTNPSRAWEQGEHAILDQVGPDLQCPKEQSHER